MLLCRNDVRGVHRPTDDRSPTVVQIEKPVHTDCLRLELEYGVGNVSELRNDPTTDLSNWVQGKAVTQVTRAHAKETIGLLFDGCSYSRNNLIEVCVNRRDRPIDIPQEKTIAAIHWAIGRDVHHVQVAADLMVFQTGALLDESAHASPDDDLSLARSRRKPHKGVIVAEVPALKHEIPLLCVFCVGIGDGCVSYLVVDPHLSEVRVLHGTRSSDFLPNPQTLRPASLFVKSWSPWFSLCKTHQKLQNPPHDVFIIEREECREMSKRLFVGGLSWGTNDESLLQIFSEFGEVVDAKVITDRDTGRSRGFAFVTFEDDESVEAAKEKMDGAELDGRTIRVDNAHERRQSR